MNALSHTWQIERTTIGLPENVSVAWKRIYPETSSEVGGIVLAVDNFNIELGLELFGHRCIDQTIFGTTTGRECC